MSYENNLVMYGAADYLRKEKEERQRFLETVERLRNLRETDPEGFDEMIEAMLLIQGEKQMNYYSINMFREYGVDDSPVVNSLLEKQQRILEIVKSNKDIEHISEAVQFIKDAM